MKPFHFALQPKSLVYPVRMMIAAILALIAAKVLGLPEAYWAPIITLIVLQTNFTASLTVSGQQLAGTALGSILGALLAMHFGPSAIAFALGVLGVGLLSVALKLGRQASRIGATALCIVLLIVRTEPPWIVALHRFLEVSVGIVVALIVSAAWPETESVPIPH